MAHLSWAWQWLCGLLEYLSSLEAEQFLSLKYKCHMCTSSKSQINSVVCLYVVRWSHCRTGPYNFLGKDGDPGGLKREAFTCQYNFYV